MGREGEINVNPIQFFHTANTTFKLNGAPTSEQKQKKAASEKYIHAQENEYFISSLPCS